MAHSRVKSLVTGGAGFMGSHLAAHLIEQGHDVVVLDDLSGGFIDNVPKGCEFVEGSFVDAQLVAKLFKEHRFEYVLHLGAYAAEGLSHFIKRFNYNNNLIGSVNLINESVKYGVRCFAFTSSIAVYGDLTPPMREDMIPVPEDSYGIAKLAVEQELRITKQMFDLNYVIFRPHNVYGENQNLGDRYRNVVGIFMNQLMQGLPLTIFGDGEQTRAFSYISDVVPFIAQALEKEEAYNQVYNLGSDQFYSVNQLAKLTMKAMGIDGNIRHLPARQETVHAYSDHEKAKAMFNIKDSVPLAEGLERMARWAKTAGSRQSQKFGNIEIDKGLPAIWTEQ